jgi:hypothetical protein
VKTPLEKSVLAYSSEMVGRTIIFSLSFQSKGSNPFLCSHMERENYSESLIKLPASGSWEKDRELQFLIRAENEHLLAVTDMLFSSFSDVSSLLNRMARAQFLRSMLGKVTFL